MQQPFLRISGNGNVSIKNNGRVAGTVPGIVYRVSGSESSTTYIPIANVVDLARWMGIESFWDGHNWINSYQSPLPKNTGHTNEDEIALDVVQNDTTSSSSTDGPAVPPEDGDTTLKLPLYPGAKPTSQKFSMAFEDTPNSWYVGTGSAEYVASVDASHLEAWYVHPRRISWGTAELSFHTSSGTVIPVNVNTDSISVNGIGIHKRFLPSFPILIYLLVR